MLWWFFSGALIGLDSFGLDIFINFGFLIVFMKIMKVLNKKIGDTIYNKYRINLPKKVVEESNLLDKEIKVRAEKEKIIIEKDLKE